MMAQITLGKNILKSNEFRIERIGFVWIGENDLQFGAYQMMNVRP